MCKISRFDCGIYPRIVPKTCNFFVGVRRVASAFMTSRCLFHHLFIMIMTTPLMCEFLFFGGVAHGYYAPLHLRQRCQTVASAPMSRDVSLLGSGFLALAMEGHQQSWLGLGESVDHPTLNWVELLACMTCPLAWW
jgi:hypothetical protein